MVDPLNPPSPRPRGRPRVHVDDAERARAHRERVQDDLTTLHMLRVIFDVPTPDLIRNLAEKYAARKEDKALAGVDFAKALLEGLDKGGGGNCSGAAAAYIRYEWLTRDVNYDTS